MKYLVILLVISLNLIFSNAQEPEWPECDASVVTWHPHPYACTRYVLCFHGNPVERLCSPGLHFNRFLEQCMFPQLAKCDINYACPSQDDEMNPVFLPDVDDCSRYFVCFKGEAISKGCAENLWWDVVYNWCTVADEVTCDSRTPNDPNNQYPTDPPPTLPPTLPPTEPPTLPPTEPPTEPPTTESTTTQNPNTYDCPLSTEPSFHPHSRECERYFICINGVAFLRQCAEGMWFDIVNRECQDRELAVCISGTSDGGESEPLAPIPSFSFVCPLHENYDFLLFPHETKCERFYVCKRGVAYIHICPDGQFYDVNESKCMDSSDAVCLKDL